MTPFPPVEKTIAARPDQRVQQQQIGRVLSPGRLVVVGEGLAAGMINFSLCDGDQRQSFAALLAGQMGIDFQLPLIQPPGVGGAPGFPRLPVLAPYDHQTTVLTEFPPERPPSNLSIPGMTVAESLSRRPAPPFVWRDDPKQTAINAVLGGAPLLRGESAALPTQLEAAVAQHPSIAIVELGFTEALEAACAGSAAALPDAARFRADYARVIDALAGAGAEVVVMTIPDPMDTPQFSTIAAAARVVKRPADAVAREHHLRANDRITVNGLIEMGVQWMAGRPAVLPGDCVVSGAVASEVTSRVQQLNGAIAAVAAERGATVCDLAALYRRVRKSGVAVAGRTLTAEFLGGFYCLNGYYPGSTGHALIANDLMDALNRAYGTSLLHVDAARVMASDPVAAYQPAEGPDHGTFTGYVASAVATVKNWSTFASFALKMVVGRLFHQRTRAHQGSGSTPGRWTLKLPPNLEQELPLSKAASYYGDALRAVHTADKDEAAFGLTGKLLFGGLALLDSHLSGTVKIAFSPPVNDIAHFEVTHGNGLSGENSRLVAPQFFTLAAVGNQVMDAFDTRSAGDLNLITGEVTNLSYQFFFLNSAILSLADVNPTLPRDPLKFPGEYGTAWAQFEQRPDGLLDYTCHASTFIPLSVLKTPIRFPLPFAGPSGHYASIPADGTALHPHIHLSTKPPAPADAGAPPEIPTNTMCELTASVHNNSFGDDFSLNAPELGGHTKGRSHLAGRFLVQFGGRFGDAVPFAVQAMPPGGMLRTLPQSPFADAFKHRIPDGLMGHNELLRFPASTYAMESVTYLDDPLDIALGVIDVRSGKVVGPLLRRGLITTNWLLAMVRIETRTPKSTFQFRGDASFERGVNNQLVFRYHGKLHIPFPEGFRFPATDLEHYILIGPDSALDPFLRWQAMSTADPVGREIAGAADRVMASTGDEFSYRFSIPADRKKAVFEYTNHTKNAVFTMEGLTSVGAINSRTSNAGPGQYDTFSFAGLGTWSLDPGDHSHVATVQVCTSPRFPYVTIMVDGGRTSSVNTKPANVDDTMP